MQFFNRAYHNSRPPTRKLNRYLKIAGTLVVTGIALVSLPDLIFSPDQSVIGDKNDPTELPNTYYRSILKETPKLRPALVSQNFIPKQPNDEWKGGFVNETVEADVCVIGGGLAGLATALGLVERDQNLRVVLLEGKRLGWGASGRNAGFAEEGFQVDTLSLSSIVKEEPLKHMLNLTRSAQHLLRSRIDKYGIQCDKADVGCVCVSVLPGNAAFQDSQDSVRVLNEKFNAGLEVWDKKKTRENYNSEKYHHAIYEKHSYTVNPLGLVLGLGRAAENQGVRIFEGTSALNITKKEINLPSNPQIAGQHKKEELYTVQTTRGGIVQAKEVVLAGSGHLSPSLDFPVSRSVIPVYTYIAVTTPIPDLDKHIQTSPFPGPAVIDDRFALNYYRPLPDNRLLWGGFIQAYPVSKKDLNNKLMNDLYSAYPQFQGKVEAEWSWGGSIALGLQFMPLIGRKDSGIWYATGFGGHGLVNTTLAGEILASAIAARRSPKCSTKFSVKEELSVADLQELQKREDEGLPLVPGEEWRLFQRHFPLKYAAFPFGRTGSQVAYWIYDLRDRFNVFLAKRRQD